jgi:predicted esterase/Tfp pilus assembly protein PilF
MQAWQKQDFTEAMNLCGEQAKLLSDDPRPFYNLACAQARLNMKAQALKSLEQAVRNGYVDDQHMRTDSDLESLRGDPAFAKLLDAVKAQREKADAAQKEITGIQQELLGLFRQKDYAKAQALCEQLTKLQPADPGHWYNLACAQARQGKNDPALASLDKAVGLGYSDADALAADEDLQSLHDLPAWKKLLGEVREAQRNAFAATYRKGVEIAGVKTLEGRPEGGLRWRLRMDPKATAAKPDRLIIWLHPSGGSMNDAVESLAPTFIRHGYAVLVATQKNFNYWSDVDARKFFEVSVAEVAKIEGIDARRPILMGFSAGGQAALVSWSQHPGQWGGMVLDAAYPIVSGPQGVEPMDLPADAAIKDVPLFVLVGEKDGGSRIWKKVQQKWKDAGVPLTIFYIPNAGHQWLLGKSQLAELESWLDQVKKRRE